MSMTLQAAGTAMDDPALAGLDHLQLGHLRHIQNLARRLPNDWSLMQGRSTGQDDFGSLRFQLAYMAYALALTHRHRLPAAPGVFKPAFARLVEKILLPEVWLYWRDVSRGGAVFNAHLVDRLHEEWDPVVRHNIMYSAYVQSMALMFNVLFDDDRFAAPGALTFRHWSFFWGGPEKTFAYDQNSLNEHIYWQMVESGHLGVACEPNCIFQICNQPAILGFRLHDILSGGTRAAEVVRGYEAAWAEFGRVGANGHYHIMLTEEPREIRPNLGKAIWVDAWTGTLMNMWNRDFVRAHYPRQLEDLVIRKADGTVTIEPPERPLVMGQTVVSDDCDFGWIAAWASEMGDEETLDGLLRHADRHMSPSWAAGGLYYPRNDTAHDGFGNRTMMEPHTGNVLLGYARLNVADGLWGLYNRPWDRNHFAEPAVTEVADDVDITRAFFDVPRQLLVVDMQRRTDVGGTGRLRIARVLGHAWQMTIDGHQVASGRSDGTWSSSGPLPVTADGADLVLTCPGPSLHTLRIQLGAPQ
ncbi:hypothetical protein [Zavarzinia sp. CC-PAN008]|uniref:linalool dehydratase/isomerase domain-containing protein n=1 Tax=Zavarzinia sp. CC-PAN008 TaxID=3243332 RepID=UPI003F7471A7